MPRKLTSEICRARYELFEELLNHISVALEETEYREVGWMSRFVDREAAKWYNKSRDLSNQIDNAETIALKTEHDSAANQPMTAPKGKQ